MKVSRAFKVSFLAFGLYAVLCAPAILVAEHLGLSESPLHLTQFLAIVGCIASSAVFLLSTRGSPFRGIRLLAAVAMALAVLWVAFLVYVIMTIDLGWD